MRVVAKIGTASITDDSGRIRPEAIAKLSAEVAELRADGNEVVIVSSGAVAAGVAALGFDRRPTDMGTLQAVAAAGQSRLVEAYNVELDRHGLVGAQVLLDPHDFFDRRQYLHARATLERLLELGAVPVVNENDTIANEELRYGDNDRLAALVGHSLHADVLVLLTDTDGVFTDDPRRNAGATLVPLVPADDPLLSLTAVAGGGGSDRGSGGMASKLIAARMASWSGIRCVIARAARPDVLAGAVSDELVGTTFESHDRALSARKLWIAFAAEAAGSLHVDAGAVRAITERPSSLLPAGVVEVRGDFVSGDTVDVVGPGGATCARGMVAVDAAGLRAVLGRQTGDLPEGMVHEVIHRDHLVVLDL
ncbi:MAG: glutamate 5-kinase [Ilumatobacteraceae bacterium]|nr:glutamate 5-kinase [Ilumatobacteraceae bacterium]